MAAGGTAAAEVRGSTSSVVQVRVSELSDTEDLSDAESRGSARQRGGSGVRLPGMAAAAGAKKVAQAALDVGAELEESPLPKANAKDFASLLELSCSIGPSSPLAELSRLGQVEQVEALKLTMRAADSEWLDDFYNAEGLRVIVERLGEIECLVNKEDDDLRLQSELLKCLKAGMNHEAAIDKIKTNPALVPALALNLSSEDVYIATQVLELLAVLMVDGPEGHQMIVDAFSYFKLAKGERVRFFSLVDALWSEQVDLAFKRDVLLFLNTLINSSADMEERILLRSDMIYAGLLDCNERLKNMDVVEGGAEGGQGGLWAEMSDERYDLEMQVQLFETVMHADNEEATQVRCGEGVGTVPSCCIPPKAHTHTTTTTTTTTDNHNHYSPPLGVDV